MSAFVVIVCFVQCGGNSSDRARIAELEAQIEELQDNRGGSEDNTHIATSRDTETSVPSTETRRPRRERGTRQFIGTYEFTDTYNRTWVLTLKDDESVTVSAKGDDGIYYGSWNDFPYDVPCLSFGWKESPIIAFPDEDEDISYGIITNEYIYASNTAYKAKNPNKRLPIKKTK